MPVASAPFIEKALVTTVPRTFGVEKLIQVIELVYTWGEDQNTGVEDIGPAYVRGSCEFMWDVEQVGKRANGKHVGIEEYDFGVLGQSENM